MDLEFKVMLELALQGRLKKWTKRSQIELSALVYILRKHGPAGLKMDSSWVPVVVSELGAEFERTSFEFKVGGVWMTFRLDTYPDSLLILRGG